MKRLADFIIDKKTPLLVVIMLLTLFFLYFAAKINVQTIYSDLLPQTHEYIKLHNEMRDLFGGSNQVLIMVQVRRGGRYKDIFNTETLTKVQFITDELLKFNAVDRYKIMSLAHRRVKDMKWTSEGMRTFKLMYPDVPRTEAELQDLRLRVYSSRIAYPGLVSLDSKNALIMVDFFEEQIDYETCFNEFQALRRKLEDENTVIAIAGEPMHLGYIRSYVKDVLKILLYTVLAMMAMFYLYFRSKRGMLLPIIAALVSAIWGLGFMSLMGFNLDPLVLVFPFLIAAMAASHSVQVVKRYKEEACRLGDNTAACKKVIEKLFKPGFAGIITDASGIIIIAITPIKLLQKITISCGFWAFATVVIAMILVPILLSYLPLRTAQKGGGFLDKALRGLGRWVCGSGKYVVLTGAGFLLVWGCTNISKITIGTAVPGSEILWPFHRYNVDSFRITFAMPMLNPLYIVLDTMEEEGIRHADSIREITRFVRHMQLTPMNRVIFAQSIVGPLPALHSAIRESDPNWNILPVEDKKVRYLYMAFTSFGGPGAQDKYVDKMERQTNIIFYCRDKTARTIKEVMGRIKDYISNTSILAREGKVEYRLAGGSVGVQAAINETLTVYQIWTFALAIGVVFIFCTVVFRSVLAGMIIVVPLLLSNALAFTFMVLNNPPIPLTTATLPVSSVGIGLGVDYGIYLLSRIIEEYKISGSIDGAVSEAMGTTGKAIVYIATTLICGIVFWFLSKLMFQALMGLLLAIILTLNMLGAILIIPSCVALFKPQFVMKANGKEEDTKQ
jgi:hypothetical protein